MTDAHLTLDQARRWASAGLDARFAAAATALGADLGQVRDLVADYLHGSGGGADLDDAWADLADTLDCHLGSASPRHAHDLELGHLLALSVAQWQELREGTHPATRRFTKPATD